MYNLIQKKYINKQNTNNFYYFVGFTIFSIIYFGNFTNSDKTLFWEEANSFFLVLVNLFLFVFSKKKEKNIVRIFFLDRIFLLYIFILLFSMFIRPDLMRAMRGTAQIILTYGIVFQVAAIMHSVKVIKLIKFLSYYFVLILLICLIVYLKNNGQIYFFNHNADFRLGGLFFFGTTAIIAGLSVLLNVYLLALKKDILFSIIKIVFSFLILFATDTRMVIAITLLGGFVIYFWKNKKSIFFVLILAILLYMTYNLISQNYHKEDIESDYIFRTYIWETTIVKINNKFFLGYGYENPFVNMLKSNVDSLQDPHSAYLSLVLRQGIIAAIALFAYYFKLLFKYRNKLIILVLYFYLVGIVGTEIFLGGLTYLNLIFNLTLFGLFLHPDLRARKPMVNNNYSTNQHFLNKNKSI